MQAHEPASAKRLHEPANCGKCTHFRSPICRYSYSNHSCIQEPESSAGQQRAMRAARVVQTAAVEAVAARESDVGGRVGEHKLMDVPACREPGGRRSARCGARRAGARSELRCARFHVRGRLVRWGVCVLRAHAPRAPYPGVTRGQHSMPCLSSTCTHLRIASGRCGISRPRKATSMKKRTPLLLGSFCRQKQQSSSKRRWWRHASRLAPPASSRAAPTAASTRVWMICWTSLLKKLDE